MYPEARAAILCGGRGERLKPLTDYFQKAMIPIGPRKLPLLAYTLAMFTRHQIRKVSLLTGYRSEDIRRYFGDGSAFGAELTYSEDPRNLVGSLNAIANALRNGSVPRSDELVIYYGDVLADLDVSALLATHRKRKADATLVLAKGYVLPVGSAQVRSGLVQGFHEKPELPLNVTTGCMVAGARTLSLIRKIAGAKQTDLMTHCVPELLRKKMRIAAYFTDKEWFDVGTVSSFEKLNEELARHPPSYVS